MIAPGVLKTSRAPHLGGRSSYHISPKLQMLSLGLQAPCFVMAAFLFVFVSLIWGSNFIMMKKAGLGFGPLTLAGGRTFGAALVLAGFWAWSGLRWPFRRGDGIRLAMIVLVGYVYPFSVLPLVISRQGSAFMGMMIGLVPLMTILLSLPMLGVRPTGRQILGVLGGLIFLGLLMGDGLRRSMPVQDVLLAASVPLCYACGNTFIKRHFGHLKPLELATPALGAAGLILLPLAWLSPTDGIRSGPDFQQAAWAMVGVTILGTGLANFLFYRIIQESGPLYAGMVAYLVPLGALVWGWLDHELVTQQQVVALLGILSMVWLVQSSPPPSPIRPASGPSGSE